MSTSFEIFLPHSGFHYINPKRSAPTSNAAIIDAQSTIHPSLQLPFFLDNILHDVLL